MNRFMKQTATWLMAALVLCLMTATVFAAGADKSAKEQEKLAKEQAKIVKQRAEIDELSEKALARLYEKVPSAEGVIENCYAYATLSNTGVKVGLFGDAHGRGLAVNNETGETLYMRMKEMGLGIGLGVKEYDLIFVIGTETAWNSFISGDIKFASSAQAAASDGAAGGSMEGASIAANGVWVYQITKKGLAVDASIKGTKIYPDKKLNQSFEQSE